MIDKSKMKFKRGSCALITIDMQNDFVLPGSPAEIPGTLKVVPKIVKLLNHFRALGAVIVHVVRFYLPDGSNADLCRREKIRNGAASCLKKHLERIIKWC